MQTGFLYHMMGVSDYECTHTEYKHGESKTLPLRNRPITLRKTIQRIHCNHRGCTVQEEIPFAKKKCQYTKRLGRYIQDL